MRPRKRGPKREVVYVRQMRLARPDNLGIS
jgi:hypothetical protein